MKKRILSTLLALCMVLMLMPVSALAEELEVAEKAEIADSKLEVSEHQISSANIAARGLSRIEYPVEGGNIYFDPETGAVTNCDKNVISAAIPSSIDGVTVTGISMNAFQGCSELTSIIFPNSLTSIGSNAFRDCSGLVSIVIPGSVTIIGNLAFTNCNSLVNMTISEGVALIGDNAFRSCSSLTNIVFPDSITSIGKYAFMDCSGLKSVVLPKHITSIDYGTFSGCSSLETISFPDSLNKIGWQAFLNCVSLKEVIIPENVTEIGVSAFNGCNGLTDLTVENKYANISTAAFNGCSNLRNITMSNNAFSNEYFRGCTSISYIKLTGDGTVSSNVDGICEITESDSLTIELEDGITSIASNPSGHPPFRNSANLTSITIPDSVTYIEKESFRNCSRLMDLTISNNTNIGNMVFEGCSALTRLRLTGNGPMSSHIVRIAAGKPLNDLEIGEGITSIANAAFSGCKGLTNVTIPNQVTSIGEYAFNSCSGLVCIVIPNSVTSIGSWAFYECSGLTNISIPNGVTSIDTGTFANCSSLTSVTIPDGVISIGNRAFNSCSGLTSVTISNSVTSIGYQAFDGCSKLTDVYYSGTKNQWNAISIESSNDSLKNATIHYAGGADEPSAPDIGSGNFGAENDNLTWTLDANGVLTIRGNGAMDDFGSSYAPWYDLREQVNALRIESGVTNIGNWAFRDCANLTSASIADSVNSIGMGTFYGCSGLKNVSLPNGIATISAWTFQKCGALQYAVIPDSVTSVQDYAFDSCGNLSDIYYPGTAEQWKGITIAQGNDPLLKAAVHYNSTGPDDSGDDILGWGSEDTQWTMEVGKKLTLTVQMADGSFIDDSKLTWTLDPAFGTAKIIDHGPQDEKTAYVTLEGVSPGKVTLRGTLAVGESILDYPTISQEITVIGQENIRFDQDTYSVKEGEVIDNITVSVPNPNGLTSKDISIISNNPDVVGNIEVTGPAIDLPTADPIVLKVSAECLKVGDATLTVKVSDGRTADCTVNVEKKVPDIGGDGVVVGKSIEKVIGSSDLCFASVPERFKGQTLTCKWTSSDGHIVSFNKDNDTAEISKSEQLGDSTSITFYAKNIGTVNLSCFINGEKAFTVRCSVVETPSWNTIASNDYNVQKYKDAREAFDKGFNEVSTAYNGLMDAVRDTLDHPEKYSEPKEPTLEEQAKRMMVEDQNAGKGSHFLYALQGSNKDLKLYCYMALCEELGTAFFDSKFKLSDLSLSNDFPTKMLTDIGRHFCAHGKETYSYSKNGRTATVVLDASVAGDTSASDRVGTVRAFWGTEENGVSQVSYAIMPGTKDTTMLIQNYLNELKDLAYKAQKDTCKKIKKALVSEITGIFAATVDTDKFKLSIKNLERVAGDSNVKALELNGLSDTIEDCFNWCKSANNVRNKITNATDPAAIVHSIESWSALDVPSVGASIRNAYNLLKSARNNLRINILEIYKDYGSGTGTLTKKVVYSCPVNVSVYKAQELIAYVGDDDIWSKAENVRVENCSGAKIIWYNPQDSISFKVVGTDDGVMHYTIEDYKDGAPVGRVLSDSINVTKDQNFTSSFPVDTVSEENREQFKLISESTDYSGSEYIPVTKSAGIEVNASVTPENTGTVSGMGTYVKGDAAVLYALPGNGYEFSGWYDINDHLISTSPAYEFSARENCTLTAKFSPSTEPPETPVSNIYFISFDTVGGSVEDSYSLTASNGTLSELSTPTREGYTFDGWYTATDGGNRITVDTIFTENTTIYAHWKEGSVVGHAHIWATAWASDANGHWHDYAAANCPITTNSQKDGYAAHTSDGGKVTTVPTAYQNGVRTYSCTVCGYVIRTESIHATGGGIIPGGGSSSSNESSYQIDVSATFNGTVTVTPKSAKSGEKVTIIATPNSGYVTNNVTVTDRSGNSVAVTNDDNGKYTFTMPASNVTVSATFTAVVPPSSKPATPAENTSTDETYLLPFTDILKTDWFYNAVEYVFNNNLMSGTAPYTFDPQGKMNRAMVWTVLGRMANADVDGSDSAWYAKAQEWATTNNVSDGTNPTNSISRQELMTMLWRYVGSPDAAADLSKFSDSGSVAGWADAAMQWAVSTGLVVGDNGRLNPTGDARRCEVATIFMRFCETIAK